MRWTVKTSATLPSPTSKIYTTTCHKIAGWAEPNPTIVIGDTRFGRERSWYTLTGRVTLWKIEDDGDIHIQLQDPNSPTSSVNVVVEVPAGENFCTVRTNAFALVNPPHFPISDGKRTLLRTNAVIRVTGRAFWDAPHAVGQHDPNRRHYNANMTIWEIHPVVDLQIIQ